MHRALAQKHLQPAEHLLDRGYVTTQVLIDSAHTHGIEVIGPMKVDTTWQAQSGKGFDIASFTLDWATQRVTCPGGQISQVWADSRDNAGHPRVYVRFAKAACQVCPLRTDCTRSVQGPRTLSFKPKAQYDSCSGHAKENIPTSARSAMPDGRALRARFLKGCGRSGGDDRGTWGKRKPLFSIC